MQRGHEPFSFTFFLNKFWLLGIRFLLTRHIKFLTFLGTYKCQICFHLWKSHSHPKTSLVHIFQRQIYGIVSRTKTRKPLFTHKHVTLRQFSLLKLPKSAFPSYLQPLLLTCLGMSTLIPSPLLEDSHTHTI